MSATARAEHLDITSLFKGTPWASNHKLGMDQDQKGKSVINSVAIGPTETDPDQQRATSSKLSVNQNR